MNHLAKLAPFLALANAQMTLTTRDRNGAIIDQSINVFTPGEPVMGEINLSFAKDTLA